jgi:hypothetical protein
VRSRRACRRCDARGNWLRYACLSLRAHACRFQPEAATERHVMARLRLHAAKALALAGLLVAGLGASAALATAGTPTPAGPSPTVPGSPGDDCSHGNSGKDCRPDPNQNGQDCQDHGNARGNEDHCDQGSTTTTTTSSSTTSTSTSTTTTTSGTSTTTSTPSTTTNTNGGTTTTTASTPPTTSTPTTTHEEAEAGASTPPTKPELQKELAKQVKGVRATGSSAAPSNPGELPFTGFPAWAIALIGSAMLLTGLGLRKAAS